MWPSNKLVKLSRVFPIIAKRLLSHYPTDPAPTPHLTPPPTDWTHHPTVIGCNIPVCTSVTDQMRATALPWATASVCMLIIHTVWNMSHIDKKLVHILLIMKQKQTQEIQRVDYPGLSMFTAGLWLIIVYYCWKWEGFIDHPCLSLPQVIKYIFYTIFHCRKNRFKRVDAQIRWSALQILSLCIFLLLISLLSMRALTSAQHLGEINSYWFTSFLVLIHLSSLFSVLHMWHWRWFSFYYYYFRWSTMW